jgi:predicted ferric reductase
MVTLSIMTAIDLSSDFGLAAITLLTVNILIGLLLSTKYNPVRNWPHRRVNTVKLHTWTGYAALAMSLVHPVLILFSSTAHFRLLDIIYPLNAPKQPYINSLGALALSLLIVIVATSYFRFEIGRRIWKPLHFATYGLFVVYAAHALLTDPNLKDAPLDPLDAEKVFVELCILLVVIGIVLELTMILARSCDGVRRRVSLGHDASALSGTQSQRETYSFAAPGHLRLNEISHRLSDAKSSGRTNYLSGPCRRSRIAARRAESAS